MTIRLRPHHLLCLLTYVGRGYTPAFVENYDCIAARLSGGEDILVVAGPDDICAPLVAGENAHCHRTSVLDRDRKAAEGIGRLLGLVVSQGTRIANTPALLQRMRSDYAARAIRSACIGCE
ncbi:DUF1284 domain-containing protein [Falsirhodobacter sp. 20TX0035]|uniref:DUF1284 domain-containing protein n=1 Tax=Falsirhodobacter sp. 20TX0035 TaxID=3022019 RepID=UPI00232D40DA|nr:DUF1284 domain-containing protein [Falsirhodobacter sp. 20TX0035]MDB6454249.1 DUF1284 domain-containing protein [Falsirhodobacter sp. 20TX0035]